MYTKEYWDSFYTGSKIGWDVGYVSTPLKEYFDQLEDKNIRILVPGAGSGYEAEYLYEMGFHNTFFMDFSPNIVRQFKERCPQFPQNQIITDDFFDHIGSYDLIVEHTFFSSFPVNYRNKLSQKVYNLLDDKGKYVGLVFNHHFNLGSPPFGATPDEYIQLFKPLFTFKIFETANNSIKPRRGREMFFVFVKQ